MRQARHFRKSYGPTRDLRVAVRSVMERNSYDVGSGKPDPGLFLHAASAMGFLPAQCAVVEESTITWKLPGAVASNFIWPPSRNIERAQVLWRGLGLEKRFDAIHYSADLGWAKPAEEFFVEIERRSGFSPAEIFFIDDKIENIEAARRRQWHASLSTGRNSLQQLVGEALLTTLSAEPAAVGSDA